MAISKLSNFIIPSLSPELTIVEICVGVKLLPPRVEDVKR